jgi:hypothetical protein
MAFVKTTWVDDQAPDMTAAQLNRLEKGIADLHNRPLVTALPAVGVVDGDEIYYLVDTTPSYGGPYIWHLRYRAAATSTSKWEALSIPNDLRRYDASTVSTANNAATDLGGPSITVPLPGDYEITYSVLIQSNKAADSQALVSIYKNAVQVNEDIAPVSPAGSVNFGWYGEQTARYRGTFAAGDVITMRYRSFTAVACGWSNRDLRLRPIRVGP